MARGTARSTSSGEGKEAAAKKTSAKKAPAKKAAPSKASPKQVKASTKGQSKLKPGTMLMVKVSPKANSDVDMAPAIVTRGLNVVGEDRVNVVAFVDGDYPRNLRNVPVLSKAPKGDDKDAPTVFALRS